MVSNGKELLGDRYERDHLTYEEIQDLDLTVVTEDGETVSPEELRGRIYRARQAMTAAEVVARILRDGGRAEVLEADLSDPSSVPRVFEAVEAALGPVDILVNNAAHCVADTFVSLDALPAVFAMPHQHEAAVTIKPERRALHARDLVPGPARSSALRCQIQRCRHGSSGGTVRRSIQSPCRWPWLKAPGGDVAVRRVTPSHAQKERVGQRPTLSRLTPFSGYGSTTTVQV